MTAGYDFFGGHAVYVEGFAQDTYCSNSIRRLTDRQTVKHVGEVGAFEEWWEAILGNIELVADDLLGFIEAASEISIDFTSVPFDCESFCELLGYPQYLASQAATDEDARIERLVIQQAPSVQGTRDE